MKMVPFWIFFKKGSLSVFFEILFKIWRKKIRKRHHFLFIYWWINSTPFLFIIYPIQKVCNLTFLLKLLWNMFIFEDLQRSVYAAMVANLYTAENSEKKKWSESQVESLCKKVIQITNTNLKLLDWNSDLNRLAVVANPKKV